jgi:ABC-2 type transport system permease protein
LKAFTAVFVARYRQFIRDRAALFFSFIFPIIFILLFGWAFQNMGTQTFRVGLANQGSDNITRYITIGLNSVVIEGDVKMFKTENGTLQDLTAKLERGDLDAVIEIPAGMDTLAASGASDKVQVYYDASQTVNQQILIPALSQVINAIDERIGGYTPPIGMNQQSVQSHELRYIDFLLPGILGMTLMFIGVQGGLPVIQQRQAHIIKRLGSTPLRRSTLVFGDLLFRMIVILASAALIILVGRLVFDVQMVGNWFSLCGIILLGSLVFVSLGYLIAAFVKTQESAIPVIQIVNLPMMILSGTFFSVASMPAFIEPLIKILPLTYVNDALRQIMVDGVPLHSMTTDIAVLAGWAVVCLGITIRFFKWD